MATAEVNFMKVDALIAEGRLFRAKETVHGMIGSYGFVPMLFTKLGDICLELGEPELAAKYWFYSGNRETRFAESTSNYRDYLARKAKSHSHWDVLIDIPKPLSRASADKFPISLREDFQTIGLDAAFLDRHLAHSRARENKIKFIQPKSYWQRIKDTALIAFGFAAFLAFFALMMAVGSGVWLLAKHLFAS